MRKKPTKVSLWRASGCLKQVSLEKRCPWVEDLQGHMPVAMHSCFGECSSNFPQHKQGRETLGQLPGNNIPSSIRSPHRHFPTEPLLQRGDTPVFWVLHGAAGSAQLQTCKIGTISFGHKPKRNSVDHPKQYQIETGIHFEV